MPDTGAGARQPLPIDALSQPWSITAAPHHGWTTGRRRGGAPRPLLDPVGSGPHSRPYVHGADEAPDHQDLIRHGEVDIRVSGQLREKWAPAGGGDPWSWARYWLRRRR
jgi:hypothetical protein